jgi:hypothetical protein
VESYSDAPQGTAPSAQSARERLSITPIVEKSLFMHAGKGRFDQGFGLGGITPMVGMAALGPPFEHRAQARGGTGVAIQVPESGAFEIVGGNGGRRARGPSPLIPVGGEWVGAVTHGFSCGRRAPGSPDRGWTKDAG